MPIKTGETQVCCIYQPRFSLDFISVSALGTSIITLTLAPAYYVAMFNRKCPGTWEPLTVSGRVDDVGIRFGANLTAELADAQRLFWGK
jgi:hypothetical protein